MYKINIYCIPFMPETGKKIQRSKYVIFLNILLYKHNFEGVKMIMTHYQLSQEIAFVDYGLNGINPQKIYFVSSQDYSVLTSSESTLLTFLSQYSSSSLLAHLPHSTARIEKQKSLTLTKYQQNEHFAVKLHNSMVSQKTVFSLTKGKNTLQNGASSTSP